jgi:FixJ family two-component response regulator
MAAIDTVFVVDDDQDFRDSLIWLLEGAGYAVKDYSSAEDFLVGYQGVPGCLLLDVRMAGMSGLALQQEMVKRNVRLPVIVITGHGDVAMAVQAMKNNAVDFLEKPFDNDVLLQLVASTLASAAEVFANQARLSEIEARWQALSKRESEVANLVVAGQSNKEVAEKLSISIKTVEIHRSRVMQKMQVRKVAELVSLRGELEN